MTTLPIPVPQSFRIIAHRGASAYVPENTLAAFQLALEMGVPDVETDVQLTTDGVAVLCHDRTLARYGHGERVVEEMAWPELVDLDMGSWFSPHLHHDKRLTTLDALFAAFGDALTYHVELKGSAPGLAAATHAIITAHNLADNCFITSFSYEWLVAMRAIDPTLRMGWLVREMTDDVLEKTAALQLYQLCPFAGTVKREQVERARMIVTDVRAWGLLGESASGQAAEVQTLIHNVLDAGCDGMTINWPDWVSPEVRSQESEVRSQKSGVRSQESEVRSQESVPDPSYCPLITAPLSHCPTAPLPHCPTIQLSPTAPRHQSLPAGQRPQCG